LQVLALNSNKYLKKQKPATLLVKVLGLG
jgi:hypothetical protein